jgi:hypothetical protein
MHEVLPEEQPKRLHRALTFEYIARSSKSTGGEPVIFEAGSRGGRDFKPAAVFISAASLSPRLGLFPIAIQLKLSFRAQ